MSKETEVDNEAIRKMLDQKMADHPPIFQPTKWSETSESTTKKIQEVNCAMNHLFALANLTEQEKITFVSERLGAWIGALAQNPEQITSSICAMVPQMLEAGREFYAHKKTAEVLAKLFQSVRSPNEPGPGETMQ